MSIKATIVVTLLVLGFAHVAGLSYCTTKYGLGSYGANVSIGVSTRVPRLLREVYDPALFAVARYYKRRGRFCCSPLDVKILGKILFVDGKAAVVVAVGMLAAAIAIVVAVDRKIRRQQHRDSEGLASRESHD